MRLNKVFSVFIFTTLLISLFDLTIFIPNSFSKSNKSDLSDSGIGNTRYLLGPGDRISIRIYKFPQFSVLVNVLPDGTINLPRVNGIQVSGLTLDQAKKVIENNYNKVLVKPVVYLDLIQARPIRVYITGEVQIPGSYTLTQRNSSQLATTYGSDQKNIYSSGWPTVVDALQKAGGLTQKANLRSIKLVRQSNNITYTEILNFWDSLESGMIFNNLKLYDGDRIIVAKVNNINEKELNLLTSSNLTPSIITVNVVGEVLRPGSHKVRANSPFMEAILQAGGVTSKAKKRGIKHVRLMDNGSLKIKEFDYNLFKKKNLKYKDVLRDKDIILVQKNNLAKTSELLSTVVEPTRPIIQGLSVYNFLLDIKNKDK